MEMDLDFAAVRARAFHDRPYFSTALAGLIPVDKTGVLPQAITGDLDWRCYYDIKLINEAGLLKAATELLAVISHLLRFHGQRRKENLAFPPIWAMGADLEIHDDLLTAEELVTSEKLKMPDGAIQPGDFEYPTGEMVEQYYHRLMEDQPPPDQQGGGGESGDNESDSRYGGAGCGSCATGSPEPYEDPAAGKDGEGTPSKGKTEQMLIQREVARQIKEHSQVEGKVPQGWKRWSEDVLESPIDPRRELIAVAKQTIGEVSGMFNYSYRKPSRRQSVMGNVIMPSMHRPLIKPGMLIDTSGSMSDHMMGQALKLIDETLKAAGITGLRVACCDAEVHNSKNMFRRGGIELLGGGGTNMSDGIRFFEDLPRNERVDILFTVTDGWTPWPDSPPPFRCVTILTDRAGRRPPFGKTIVWDDSPKEYE